MQVRPESRSRPVQLIIALVAGLVAAAAALWAAGEATTWATIRVLDALDMLSPAAYDTGTPAVAEPALWVIATLYAAPAVLAVSGGSVSRLLASPSRSQGFQRVLDPVLSALALVVTLGVTVLALHPTRGHHESITDRVPELTTGPAHLVVAATWTMLAMLLIALLTRGIAPSWRVALQLVAFVGVTTGMGSLFA